MPIFGTCIENRRGLRTYIRWNATLDGVNVIVKGMEGVFVIVYCMVQVPQSKVFVLRTADQLAPYDGQSSH